MKDDVRIIGRLTSLEVGQSAEFSTRVFTPVPTVDENNNPIPQPDRSTVNEVLLGEAHTQTYSHNGNPDYLVWEASEDEAMLSLARGVVAAERWVQDGYRPQRVHYATQKIERRFSTAMGDTVKGVHSTLSITVYRVK